MGAQYAEEGQPHTWGGEGLIESDYLSVGLIDSWTLGSQVDGTWNLSLPFRNIYTVKGGKKRSSCQYRWAYYVWPNTWLNELIMKIRQETGQVLMF